MSSSRPPTWESGCSKLNRPGGALPARAHAKKKRGTDSADLRPPVLKNEHPAFNFSERMIPRPAHLAAVKQNLRDNPVVAVLGARQVGKTGSSPCRVGRRVALRQTG